jgi:gliding motility-associated protein GldE
MTILSVTLFLVLLLILSALVSGSEVAFFSLSRKDLDEIKAEENRVSNKILKLRSEPRRLLATILISNNLINISIVIISDFLIRNVLGDEILLSWAEGISKILPLEPYDICRALSFLITIVGVTFLLVLFGEVAPKIYANLNNMKFAKLMATPMSLLSAFFKPISVLLVRWSSKLESRFIQERTGIDDTSKEDLDKAILLTVNNEDESSEEVDILRGIIKFGNVSAKQIMKSRVDVIAIEEGGTYGDLMAMIKESGFSRIPVYSEDFDNITGILYVKDLLGCSMEDENFNWKKLIRTDVLYAPESKKIDDLLKEFQKRRLHLAVIVDEFGGSAGIVTLEDIMEEVIGEIKDEFDDDEEVDYIKINDYNYIFEGKTLLNDVARIVPVEKNIFENIKGEADSLAGLILEHLGRIPKKDKTLVLHPFKFKIVSVSKRRIEKIHVTLL